MFNGWPDAPTHQERKHACPLPVHCAALLNILLGNEVAQGIQQSGCRGLCRHLQTCCTSEAMLLSTQHGHMLVPHVHAWSAEAPLQNCCEDRGHPGASLHAWEPAAQGVKALHLSMDSHNNGCPPVQSPGISSTCPRDCYPRCCRCHPDPRLLRHLSLHHAANLALKGHPLAAGSLPALHLQSSGTIQAVQHCHEHLFCTAAADTVAVARLRMSSPE